MDPIFIGNRIRLQRKALGKNQSEIANSSDISVSYFNMIENGKRKVAGQLLSKIARSLEVSVDHLWGQQEAKIATSLSEILSDLRTQGWRGDLSDHKTSIAKLSADHPAWVEVILHLHQQSTTIHQFSGRLQGHASIENQLSDTGYQVLQHLTTLSSAAGILHHSTDLSNDERSRFGTIVQKETKALEDLSREFFDRLQQLGRLDNTQNVQRDLDLLLHKQSNHFPELEALAGQAQRSFDNQKHPATPPFEAALRWVQDHHRVEIESVLVEYASGKSAAFQNSLYLYLVHYTAAALIMPYDLFLKDAIAMQYDVDALAHQYRVSFEQVCHRLTSLRKSGSDAIAFAFMKVDAGGNVIKSYSLANFYVPSSGSICPRWPIFAFAWDGLKTVTHKIVHDQNGAFLAITRPTQAASTTFGKMPSRRALMLVCDWASAHHTIYADYASDQPITCGTSCSICHYPNCPDRLRSSLWNTQWNEKTP